MSRLISATAFAGAVLAFALPFGAVSSCGGDEVRFTGVQLATFTVPADESEGGDLQQHVEGRAGLLALIAVVAAAAGVALTTLDRRGAGVCASLGLVVMQLLGYAIVSASDSADLFAGYWLALGLFALAAAVQLTREISTRRRSGESVWLPIGLAVAVPLPPVGLVVALLLWLAAAAISAARHGLRARRAV